MSGRVYLVGAGPGNAGLLTLRGREVLGRAEVLICDDLCDEAMLALAPEGAERHAVGRWPDHIAHPQGRIAALLVERAREGRTVVRLKNGDPLLFGRGEEEARALAEAAIPFEIVPGVPAVTAAAAWAGIALTDRAVSSELRCLIVQSGADPASWGLDLDALASARGTVALYLDPAVVPALARELVGRGRAPHSLAALVAAATLPQQRVARGTLEDVAAAAARFGPPALLFLGEAVAAGEGLRWAEARPLHGRSVVVTRPRAQAAEMVELLEELGAEVLVLPCIDIAPPEDAAPLDRAIARVGGYDWVVFSSANGVERFFDQLRRAGRDARAFGRARVAAVGRATAQALEGRGVVADRVPDEFHAEGLAASFAREPVAGLKFLLVRAQEGREVLGEALTALGAEVDQAAAYRTVRPAADPSKVRARFAEGRLSAVAFASPSAVRNFLEQFEPGEAMEILGRTPVAVIGPVSARAVEKLGVKPAICPDEFTGRALVQALAAFFAGRAER